MSKSYNLPLRVAAVVASASVVALSWAPAASAAEGDIEITNTETISVYTDATGAVRTKRVYEQLAFTGEGTVDIANPIETDGLRNLDGFGGVETEGGNQLTTVTVDGSERMRSVSNFEGELPLEIDVTYLLDGEEVEPGDVVGEDGRLEVLYRVTNVTAAPQELSFDDGNGGTVTKTVEVPIPMVGSLTTIAPPSFTDVQSKQANIAGDGKGGTKLSFTMTLFPPLGSDTAEFGYTANIVDGVVPRADVAALPVNPLESPTFASAASSYKGGADTGLKLADGAGTIDENLLKLRDGAGDLLAGLIKLRDGSNELHLGLAGSAVPGARKLADGAGQLADGTGTLLAGSAKLDAGAGLISNGQQDLLAGLRLLEAGVEGLPASVREQLQDNADYQALLEAMGDIVAGIGNNSQVTDPVTGSPATLFGALNAIEYGLRNPTPEGGNDCLASLFGLESKNCGAMDAVETIAGQLAASATSAGQLWELARANYEIVSGTHGCPALVPGKLTPANGDSPEIAPEDAFIPAGTPCYVAGYLVNAIGGAPGEPQVPTGGIIYRSTAANKSLTTVYEKVDAGIVNKAIPGIKLGLHNPAAPADCAAAKATKTEDDDCGIQDAVAYFQKVAIPSLVDGITNSIASELIKNIGVPAGGCKPDTRTLVCGATALADGGSQLAAGTGELADGAVKLDDGAGQIADGSDQLADGLGDAADGSGLITDGLGQAADGAPKLVDGAQRLSDEGTKKLVEAGEDTAQNYGEMYATINAGAERAQAEKMAYGAPEGAFGLTAYSYVIQGENGEGGRNLARGLTGLALLGAGAGAFALRRGLA